MIRYLKVTWIVFYRYRHLLFNLVGRDFKVKYRRSALGVAWSVLNPLLMMLVMWLVFGNLFADMVGANRMELVSFTGRPPPFPVYLLTGQLIFGFFNDATTAAMDSVLNNHQLIKKVYIPKYIFPLEKVLFAGLNALFSLIALAAILLLTGSPVNGWVLLVPVCLALLFLFNLGVGLILSTLVVLFRDIKHLYSVFVLALTYLTPVFYSEHIMGDPLRIVLRANPLYWYVGFFRQAVVYGEPPSEYQWLAVVGCAALALLAGLLLFRKKQDDFILYV